MNIKHVECTSWLLPKTVEAITIYPYIFYNCVEKPSKKTMTRLKKHEMVHVAQVERVGWIRFYTVYIYHKLKGTPFKEIPFEKEAYGE